MQTSDNGVDLSVRQMCQAWHLMCRDSPTRHVASEDGIEFIFGGLPIPFFNVAVLTGASIAAPALLSLAESARAWAAHEGVPWFFVVTHDTLAPGVEHTAILGDCGLAPVLSLTGMLATQILPGPDAPAGLQITVPQDEAGCAAIFDINSKAYEMDLGPAKSVLGARFWGDQVPVLGTVDGAPVSTASVLMVDGYRYVALVATDPTHRRRGYADVVMRHALEVAAAAHGPLPTVLHATDAGRPIYERMGYTPISMHTLYLETTWLGGH